MATWFLFGAASLLLGLVTMAVLTFAAPDSLTALVVGIGVVFATYVFWAVPFVLINNLGVKLQKQLKSAGVETDRRAPLHSQRLYQAWLTRNRLTADQVVQAVQQ